MVSYGVRGMDTRLVLDGRPRFRKIDVNIAAAVDCESPSAAAAAAG